MQVVEERGCEMVYVTRAAEECRSYTGRHELLEGFKVNCDLFEFDMVLHAKGGCWEDA